jgi:Domain of unknown function (DUF4082)
VLKFQSSVQGKITAIRFYNAPKNTGTHTALASGSSGGNGVYAYGSASTFPTNTWNVSNYWVDIVVTTS